MMSEFALRTKLNRKLIDELVARRVSDPAGLWRLASLYRQVGEIELALETLERVPEADRTAAMHRLAGLLARRPLDRGVDQSGFQPSPFVVFDGFLDDLQCDVLTRCARERRAEFGAGQVYTPDHQDAPIVRQDARTSLVLSAPADIAGWLLPLVRERVAEALPVLGVNPFDLFDTEIHVSASGNGDRLKCHQDVRPSPAPQRRISYVLYFGVGERRFEGGDFILYDTDVEMDRWDPANYTRIEPVHNRLLLFAGQTYHEVAEVRCDPDVWEARRFAVCGWFRAPVGDSER